jgi:hypothetical protein
MRPPKFGKFLLVNVSIQPRPKLKRRKKRFPVAQFQDTEPLLHSVLASAQQY